MRREIEKAWKMVDMTQEREERARETIETLNTEIQNLTKVIEEKTLGAEDTNINELRKLRDELVNQRDGLKTEVEELEKKDQEQASMIKNLNLEISKLESKVAAITNDLQSRTNEMNREIRRKERTEREVKQLKLELDERGKEIAQRSNETAMVKSKVTELEEAVLLQKQLNESLQQQLEVSNSNNSTLQGQIEMHGITIQHLEQDLSKKGDAVKDREAQVNQIKIEEGRLQKELEESRKKHILMEKAKSNVEVERSKLKEDLVVVKKEVKELKHQTLVERKKLESKKHESVALEHSLKRMTAGTKKQEVELQQALDMVAEKHQALLIMEQKLEKQRLHIANVEAERDGFVSESKELAKRVDVLLEDSRDAESVVFTYRKQQSEMESQLQQQLNLYQAARNDRTMLTKSLTEAQDEISDLKSKLRVLQHQFDQLKEDMVAKESALVKENQEQQKLLKEKEDLHGEMEKERDDTKTAKQKCLEVEKNFGMIKERCRALDNDLAKCQDKLEQVGTF